MIRGDSRLHINLSFPIEYRIPEICNLTKSVILGDRDKKDIWSLMEELKSSMKLKQKKKKKDDGGNVHNVFESKIIKLCNALEEHAHVMTTMWFDYLHSVATNVQTQIHMLTKKSENAQNMFFSSHQITNQQYLKELERIEHELETFIENQRTSQTPMSSRPEIIVNMSKALEKDFLSSRMPLRDRLRGRSIFEKRVNACQTRAVHRVARKILLLVK